MFETRYEEWLEKQKGGLTGEALRRLVEGHAHNERLFLEEVWFPAIGSFDDLHAEYEVRSYMNGNFYLDFAYLRPPYCVNWEVDDFSSHAKNVTRRTHNYNCDRQNQLVLDGWTVFRLNLDAIRERPKQVQQFVLQVMGKLYGTQAGGEQIALTLKQREILRLGHRLQRAFTPKEVCEQLGIRDRHARDLLHDMLAVGLLEAAGGHVRVRSYRLTSKAAYLYLP
ncbi:DNA-binding response regulator [Cohnella yongneupensis]|uniref:DNA-binding response regulator n=1 Tax=Cohnella yongneupensis TaxID=425006 RepID=A0ABW0R0Q2_9BACL